MDLERLTTILRDAGAVRAYVKWLAPNDNSKNQIFLGRDFSALNILPIGAVAADASGKHGRLVFKAALDLWWSSTDGTLSHAPHAKLILYPQYPEVRLSGFLLGCRNSPSEILNSRRSGRALVLALTSQRRIIGFAVGSNSPLNESLPRRAETDQGVLVPLALKRRDTRTSLIREFRRIHGLGWIDSKRLDRTGAILRCEARNCGGLTLEAELGIRPNSFAEPDYAGWEVKQFTATSFDHPTGILTLMTPEPDGGYYKQAGVEAFVRKFGYPDRHGREDRLNFGGVHSVSRRCERTGLTLRLEGFDSDNALITDPTGGVCLESDRGEIAAMWHFAKLMKHWNRKHERAAYSVSKVRLEPRRQYCYGPVLLLGEGTDFLSFLSAVANSSVYYDPGIKLTAASSSDSRTKRRSQFRIRASKLPQLYRAFEGVRLD